MCTRGKLLVKVKEEGMVGVIIMMRRMEHMGHMGHIRIMRCLFRRQGPWPC